MLRLSISELTPEQINGTSRTRPKSDRPEITTRPVMYNTEHYSRPTSHFDGFIFHPSRRHRYQSERGLINSENTNEVGLYLISQDMRQDRIVGKALNYQINTIISHR